MKKLTIYQYLLVIFIIVIISSSGSSGIIITFVIAELLNLVSKQLFLCAKIVQIRTRKNSVFGHFSRSVRVLQYYMFRFGVSYCKKQTLHI